MRLGENGNAKWWRAWLEAASDCLPNWLFLPGLRIAPARKLTLTKHPVGRSASLVVSTASLANETEIIAELATQLRPKAQLGNIDVVCNPDSLFSREVWVPRAGLKDAAQILRLDLENALPFPAAEVLTAETRWKTDGKTVYATQYLLKKTHLEALADALLNWGGAVRTIRVAKAPGAPLLFDGRRITDRPARRWGVATFLIAAGAIGVVATTQLQKQTRLSSQVATLQEEVSNLTERSVALRTELDAAKSARGSDLLAYDALEAAAGRVSVLSTLSQVLGDETWVSELTISGQNVLIAGFTSGASAEVIETIEREDWAANTQMTAPSARDVRSGKERFQLRFDLERLMSGSSP